MYVHDAAVAAVAADIKHVAVAMLRYHPISLLPLCISCHVLPCMVTMCTERWSTYRMHACSAVCPSTSLEP
jgi:hypothetical protein